MEFNLSSGNIDLNAGHFAQCTLPGEFTVKKNLRINTDMDRLGRCDVWILAITRRDDLLSLREKAFMDMSA